MGRGRAAALMLLLLLGATALSTGCGDGADGSTDGLPDDWWDSGTDDIVCTAHIEYTPEGTPGAVTIGAEWNDYDAEASPMTNGGNGTWTYDVELAPGNYAYKFIVDGAWEDSVPADVYTQWSGDVENRSLRVRNCGLPLLETVSASADADGSLQAEVRFTTAADEVAIDPDAVTVTVGGVEVAPDVNEETGVISISATGLAEGKHSVRVWAADTAGRSAENEPLFIPLWVEDEAFEWNDAVMYLIFTDRFRDGDGVSEPVSDVEDAANYSGGDFLGVVDTLDDGYFDDMGVNLLWLSPHYQNPDTGYDGADGHQYTGYHGYWPVDPILPESKFGDADATAEERLKELIDEAHSRGIRVLFDLVMNHLHEDHVYVSEHPDWFATDGCVCGDTDCDWDSHALDCWFRDYLPDLDYRQPGDSRADDRRRHRAGADLRRGRVPPGRGQVTCTT